MHKPSSVLHLKAPVASQRPSKRKALPPAVQQEGELPHLLAWLQEEKVHDDASHRDARSYLLGGTPFRGDSKFASKDLVVGQGATWTPNAEKTSRHFGNASVAKGWWSASTVDVLRALLTLGSATWTPVGLDKHTRGVLAEMLSAYDAHKRRIREGEEREAEAIRIRRNAQDDELLKRRRESGIPVDRDDEIEELRTRWRIEWTASMGARLNAVPQLGPRMGLSSAQRALRGLRLNLIDASAVRLCGTAAADVAESEATQSAQSEADLHVHEKKTTHTEMRTDSYGNAYTVRGAECIHFSKFETFGSVGGCVTASDIVEPANVVAAKPTSCIVCGCWVFEQFLDCGCEGRRWRLCKECGSATSTMQACPCALQVRDGVSQ